MRKIILILIVAVLGITLLYISRFWLFNLWDRPGLFDLKSLPPKGGLLLGWLRDIRSASSGYINLIPFELMIWAIGGFLALTGLEKLFDRFKKT